MEGNQIGYEIEHDENDGAASLAVYPAAVAEGDKTEHGQIYIDITTGCYRHHAGRQHHDREREQLHPSLLAAADQFFLNGTEEDIDRYKRSDDIVRQEAEIAHLHHLLGQEVEMEEVHDGIEDHGEAHNRHGANGHRLPFGGRNHLSKREPGEFVMSEGEPYDEYAQKSDDKHKRIDGFLQGSYLLAMGARRDVQCHVESHQESSQEDGAEIFRQEQYVV